MEQTITMMIIALMMSASHPAMAQSGVRVTPQQQQENKILPSLDERFAECMGNDSCTLRDRMRIMGEMNDEMSESLQRMNRNCMMMDYNECIGPQRAEREQWNKMNSRMREMMQSMESRQMNPNGNVVQKYEEKEESSETLNKAEPSAGEENGTEEKENFWRWPKLW